MAEKRIRTEYGGREVFVVKATFFHRDRAYGAGETVLAGDPVLKGREQLFMPFVPTYGAAPEPEPVSEPAKPAAKSTESEPAPEKPEAEL
ncbi:MAG: hypothetical protein ABSB75_04485 [Candidatus Limnocylindrales bacterium]